VPFCEDCQRFYTPSTLTAAGDCPEGHHVAEPGEQPPIAQSTAEGREEEKTKVPWHFWLLVIALVIYLGWRLIQMIGWLIN
jgi:hypothetical protein